MVLNKRFNLTYKFNQVYVNLNFVNFLGVNPPFLVHKSLVHKIQVHKSLGRRKFGIFLWFTFFLSSQISSEPVNHGSQITPAPIKPVNTYFYLPTFNHHVIRDRYQMFDKYMSFRIFRKCQKSPTDSIFNLLGLPKTPDLGVFFSK